MKKNNHSKSKKKQAKPLTWYQLNCHLGSWNENKTSDRCIEELCVKITEHFKDKSNIQFVKFINSLGISYNIFLAWTKKHPNLAEVYQLTMEQIGEEREKLAMFKQYNTDPKTIHFTLQHYNPIWKKSIEEERDFRLQVEKNNKLLEELAKQIAHQEISVDNLSDQEDDAKTTDRDTAETE